VVVEVLAKVPVVIPLATCDIPSKGLLKLMKDGADAAAVAALLVTPLFVMFEVAACEDELAAVLALMALETQEVRDEKKLVRKFDTELFVPIMTATIASPISA